MLIRIHRNKFAQYKKNICIQKNTNTMIRYNDQNKSIFPNLRGFRQNITLIEIANIKLSKIIICEYYTNEFS